MGAVTTAVIVGGVVAAGVSTGNAISQSSKEKQARTDAATLEGQLADKRASMQAIKNPYENATNPYKNIGHSGTIGQRGCEHVY